MNKALIITFSLVVGFGLGVMSSYFPKSSPRDLSVEEMHNQIVQQRGEAIEKAKRQGKYNCCYKPGCTMCFMEENRWNNEQKATCDCAAFIAQGEKPCPQCVEALN